MFERHKEKDGNVLHHQDIRKLSFPRLHLLGQALSPCLETGMKVAELLELGLLAQGLL